MKGWMPVDQEYFDSGEKLLELCSKVKFAEESRLRGEPTVSLCEARERLEQKYSISK